MFKLEDFKFYEKYVGILLIIKTSNNGTLNRVESVIGRPS